MAISWRRFRKNQKLAARIHVEHLLEVNDLLYILGGYASEYLSSVREDNDATPPPLTKREAEQLIRTKVRTEGESNIWMWSDLESDAYTKRCRKWAQDSLAELWPELAKDFRAAEL